MCAEVVHEVLGGDVASLVFVFFGDDLTQLLGDSLADLLKNEGQRLVFAVSSDVFSEVNVDFLGDSASPALNLVGNEVNFLAKFIALFFVFAQRSNMLVQLLDFRR